MNRFVKTLSLLIISLFLLGAGIDATLDRLAKSPQGNQLSLYGADGRVVAVYSGDLRDLMQIERADRSERTPVKREL